MGLLHWDLNGAKGPNSSSVTNNRRVALSVGMSMMLLADLDALGEDGDGTESTSRKTALLVSLDHDQYTAKTEQTHLPDLR